MDWWQYDLASGHPVTGPGRSAAVAVPPPKRALQGLGQESGVSGGELGMEWL